MLVTYIRMEWQQGRRRAPGDRPGWSHAGVLAAAAIALACASRSPLPRGAPPLAPGSTPEPVRYEVVVPGARAEVHHRLVELLDDSLFHVSRADPGSISAYNLYRLVKVYVDLTRAGRDSVRVGLTGETYAGDTARRDSISGLPERWRLITATDGARLVLRDLARAVWVIRPEIGVSDAGDGPVASVASVASLSAEPRPDPQMVAMLAATPVGRSVEVCRTAAVPPNWLILYWSVDSSRCRDLPDTRYPGEPNVMRIEREW